jgi:ligand-binding SRPBCC domain-containing protein
VKLYRFEARQALPASLSAAWEFFSDPRNLSRITPPALDFKILADLPEKIHAGMLIPYRVRPLAGIPVTWVTAITHVEGPRLFVDEQLFGPYRFWSHQHFFKGRTDRRGRSDGRRSGHQPKGRSDRVGSFDGRRSGHQPKAGRSEARPEAERVSAETEGTSSSAGTSAAPGASGSSARITPSSTTTSRASSRGDCG